ncbi:hypothetical protein SARC_07086 [Sphaeroforma arctica JP610]|uniref:C3H1-type domain-containing protein n=1 Tax=Sphaeroforma arctica JP610 TaxID=667725 RepID=A0A0L0FV94_9EUKA|nr:hypothetical protein SARC_07086 [Sphaeroforma arctica JP610]KNC80554.1 hypothetical protein SARC_07086 [Sphaeroforma arctica JP610]|eukprot:XP_014154456.1 hypothetical protein SARC_07086 [Sphaeroforma arctica JP610]
MVETGTTGELEPVTSVAHFAPRDRSAQAAHLVGQLKRSAVDPGNTLTAGEVDTTRGTDMCVTTTTNTNNEASENHTKHTTTPEAKSSRNRSRKHPHVSDEHVHTTNTQASKTHTPPGTGQGTGEHAHAHAPVCTPTVLRVCQDYANHGHCRAGHTACLDSHDLDLILHLQDMGAVGLRVIAGSSGGLSVASSDGVGRTEQLSKRQLKRIKLKHKRASLQLVAKQPSVTAEANNTVVATTGNAHPHSAPFEDSSSIQARYSHRAGFDAFMTGYVYATDTLTYDTATLATMKNNIHLSYKQIPLHLTKSAYVNYSAGFLEKEKAAAIQTRAESYAADPK